MSSFIVEDFDLYHCSIALTVTQELNFDFDASEETKVLLKEKVLRLTPVAFGTTLWSVTTQMGRIAKYLQRGYKWRVGPDDSNSAASSPCAPG